MKLWTVEHWFQVAGLQGFAKPSVWKVGKIGGYMYIYQFGPNHVCKIYQTVLFVELGGWEDQLGIMLTQPSWGLAVAELGKIPLIYSCRGFEANPLYIELWIYYRCKRNLILTSLALWIFKMGQTVQKLAKFIPSIFRTIFLSVHVSFMSEFLRIFLHTNLVKMKLLIFQAIHIKIIWLLTWEGGMGP